MSKSTIDIYFEHHYTKSENKRVKVAEKRKVNGKYVTVYVYKNKKVKVNKTTTKKIPVLPETLPFSRTRSYEDIGTINRRTHTRTGALSPISFPIQSFFPGQRYSFAQTSYSNPVVLAKWFEDRQENESKLLVKIPAMRRAFWANIRSFEWSYEAGTYDIVYTMQIHQERKPKVKTKKVK
ncbi:hypothetical protein ADM98_11430 [Exiguobacterium sp. BMC-KP]|uniref:hypothetical protein n=1 Tax=Exiguobacterium sp. BMC-KP TaxID=1684312 RepID=UPI0006AA49CC|nr:hypothetical protein [Exiguobacterium sp. BMC-KP]KOP29479.1 hypothetical protein ADM98_11430 [Exiguobacterium sp. BMC-KP]